MIVPCALPAGSPAVGPVPSSKDQKFTRPDGTADVAESVTW